METNRTTLRLFLALIAWQLSFLALYVRTRGVDYVFSQIILQLHGGNVNLYSFEMIGVPLFALAMTMSVPPALFGLLVYRWKMAASRRILARLVAVTIVATGSRFGVPFLMGLIPNAFNEFSEAFGFTIACGVVVVGLLWIHVGLRDHLG